MKRTRSVSEAVMAQIKTGQVHMKPRRYFAVLGLISVAAIVTLSALSAYLFSVLFYWVRIETADSPAWGARQRLSDSLASFPWWALGLAVMLTGFTVWLVRRHGRMYRHRTFALAFAIAATSLLAGLLLSYVNIGQTHTPLRENQPQGQHEQQNGFHSGRNRY